MMVTMKVPRGIVLVVETVRIDDPGPLTTEGLNVAVAPAGTPLTLSDTFWLNPFSPLMFTVYWMLPPMGTVCVAGVAETVKSGAGAPLTVRTIETACVRLPLVPVMVIV